MSVRAVVFDLDQTLFDHESSARQGVRAWLARQGEQPTDALVERWFAAEREHFTAWREGRVSWDEQRRRRVRDLLVALGHPVGDDAALDAGFAAYLRDYEAAWRGFDDAAPCVRALREAGVPLAVLTNGAEDQQRAKLAAVGLAGAFDAVLTAEALGCAKPDPRTYLAACEALALPPQDCLYVGDDAELDVRAPRRVGMAAVHLDRTGSAPAEPWRITTLADLPGLVLGSGPDD